MAVFPQYPAPPLRLWNTEGFTRLFFPFLNIPRNSSKPRHHELATNSRNTPTHGRGFFAFSQFRLLHLHDYSLLHRFHASNTNASLLCTHGHVHTLNSVIPTAQHSVTGVTGNFHSQHTFFTSSVFTCYISMNTSFMPPRPLYECRKKTGNAGNLDTLWSLLNSVIIGM